ncbi:cancer-related nucleoside-triphosphatase homolog [Penaeus japonicus]|uniref:cancer-related nucleoside-triphosphatase homolog n=1 Tax=Penaeus japonicus TaxID=27405 RepID=UPI001C714AEA|nr:cancer-related nucleoside-triphosphatase homolog [Penaeus japonicus]
MSYKHVAITGPPGVGKTTLVQKIVKILQDAGLPCSGFYTQEVRQGGKRIGFDVVTLDGKTGILSRVKSQDGNRRECRVGQYVVDVPAFESLALPLLRTQTSSPQILVLDEIGKMEMFSQGFVTNVQRILAQPGTTVLATIPIPKGKPIPLVEQIRNNKNVFLVNLSKANRDDEDLKEEIVKTLKSSLGK